MTPTRVFPPRLRILLAASALLVLAACAGVPPPTGLMQRAQQQLKAADKVQAADYAPVDLTFAKQRFSAAQAAMSAKKYALAQDMANESLADGRLAQVRAELATVRKQIRAQSAENKRLRTQLLSPSAPSAGSSSAPASSNSGLPAQIVLPQPAPPASSAPANAVSSGRPSTGGNL